MIFKTKNKMNIKFYVANKIYIFNISCTICEVSQIQYTCILCWGLSVMHLMPEDGQNDRNMLRVLVGLIKFVVDCGT